MGKPMLADPQLAREGSRDVVEVAVGVLLQPDGAFLLTSRPEGKVYAGYWEFPGGKLEAGESVVAALRRELYEELDITVHQAIPWRDTLVDYPHAVVRLNFCKVFTWVGNLRMREGQTFSWQQLPVSVIPILPGTIPVLSMLADERHFLAPTHQ